MPGKRNKGLKYTRIPYSEIGGIVRTFEKIFNDFLSIKGFPAWVERHISFFTLIDIIVRVDKRRAYYQCFHGMEINECKEAALYAYWILKLRPFSIIDKKFINNQEACTINESFVIHFIGFVLESTGRIKRTNNIKESYRKFLEYSFRFRNFSIDSFLVLVESISTETLEKEYPDLSGKMNLNNI
ncbi:hypothetical protein AGMMS49928_16470 [Spirochaetia bacterium]|nr:hypothetical protein AGMMS49928_16470 [Spirochaetia bacterium]